MVSWSKNKCFWQRFTFTAEDPEAWTKLDEIGEELQNLRRLLNATENLVFSSSEDKENLDGNYLLLLTTSIWIITILLKPLLKSLELYFTPSWYPVNFYTISSFFQTMMKVYATFAWTIPSTVSFWNVDTCAPAPNVQNLWKTAPSAEKKLAKWSGLILLKRPEKYLSYLCNLN